MPCRRHLYQVTSQEVQFTVQISECIKKITTLPKITRISIKKAPVLLVEVEVDNNQNSIIINQENQENKPTVPTIISYCSCSVVQRFNFIFR